MTCNSENRDCEPDPCFMRVKTQEISCLVSLEIAWQKALEHFLIQFWGCWWTWCVFYEGEIVIMNGIIRWQVTRVFPWPIITALMKIFLMFLSCRLLHYSNFTATTGERKVWQSFPSESRGPWSPNHGLEKEKETFPRRLSHINTNKERLTMASDAAWSGEAQLVLVQYQPNER